jgi:uncharacterized OsmC-like protein
MDTQSEIKAKFERNAKATTLKPSLGAGTSISTTKVTDGLACSVREGDWRVNVDMPSEMGGENSQPTPGVFGRAALGSCLAIGYKLHASKMGIPITSIEVIIEADWDMGAVFGTIDTVVGYSEVRYCVKVESSASEEQIIELLDIGDKHSPYLDVFSRAQSCKRKVEIIRAQIG